MAPRIPRLPLILLCAAGGLGILWLVWQAIMLVQGNTSLGASFVYLAFAGLLILAGWLTMHGRPAIGLAISGVLLVVPMVTFFQPLVTLPAAALVAIASVLECRRLKAGAVR